MLGFGFFGLVGRVKPPVKLEHCKNLVASCCAQGTWPQDGSLGKQDLNKKPEMPIYVCASTPYQTTWPDLSGCFQNCGGS
jgi:hypothetical protein